MSTRVWMRAPLAPWRHGLWQPNARQCEVVDHVAAGLSNAEIAELLHCSEGAVKSALHAMCAQWEVSERAGVVGEAFRRGHLLPVPGDRVLLGEQDAALLRAWARGETHRQIAQTLRVHRSTVTRRTDRLVKQLGLRNVANAVAVWQARGEEQLAPLKHESLSEPVPEISAYLMQVLELLAVGRKHGQIAARLGVAPGSVRSRVATLRELANVDDDVAVVGWACWTGLLRPKPRPAVAVRPQIVTMLEHVAAGRAVWRAAELMRISEHEVHELLGHAFRVFGVRTAASLVTAAFATGVLRPRSVPNGSGHDKPAGARDPTGDADTPLSYSYSDRSSLVHHP